MNTHALRNRRGSALLAAVVTAALTLGATPAAHAAEDINVAPTGLALGAPARIPYVANGQIVDGDKRTPVGGDSELIATTPSGYIVLDPGYPGTTELDQVLKVDGTDQNALVALKGIHDVQVSSDGSRLAVATSSGATGSVVYVYDITTGGLVTQRTFPGRRPVLGIEGKSVYLGGEAGTYRWLYDTNTFRLASPRQGYLADLRHGLVAGYTADPANGGCTAVWQLASPQEILWRTCTEEVADFNAAGTRVATYDLQNYGPELARVYLRGLRGAEFGKFSLRDGRFAPEWRADVSPSHTVDFESASTLLLKVRMTSEATGWVRAWPQGANRVAPAK